MTDAREAVLGRIRAALGVSAADDEVLSEYAAIPRTYVRTGQLDPGARLRLFAERLRDYDAVVRETGEDGAQDAIRASVAGGAGKYVVAEGFPAELLPSGVAFAAEAQTNIAELDACAGVITICAVAIASSGTIVLTHGAGEGARRLTLVPDRHVCVVRAAQVVETMPEAMDRLAPPGSSRFATTITFISGPSATADIEMTRIRGVHGPRHLEVILVL
jgi:L-lactate dehydrogenase complex protein LldG